MAKVASRYLRVDPWVIEEKGFHPSRNRVSESIFSIGNEFMGVRGYFEEGYSGETILGSYFNGVFERTEGKKKFFKGIVSDNHFMVNAVDWLYTRISLDGEQLDIAKSSVSGFSRRLDLRTGVLTREFIWTTCSGKRLQLTFRRFTSMLQPHIACQRVTMRPLNFSGAACVESGLDFSIVHFNAGRCLWECICKEADKSSAAILGRLPSSGHMVFSAFMLRADSAVNSAAKSAEKYAGVCFDMQLAAGKPSSFEKTVYHDTVKQGGGEADKFWSQSIEHARAECHASFAQALQQHVAYWSAVWRDLDVVIKGDKLNQQGIRFCIFQLHQTYHGVDPADNISAKGLTGEFYEGKTWWDTETYCLPFYLFNNPKAARNLLEYRHRTLDQALERAPQVDGCCGARYPMCTIDGRETCSTWQHGDLEIHVSAAVAFGIWHYTKVTGEREYLYEKGIDVLIEVCRYFASRGQWSQKNGDFGFWNVMGADEFHMQVHNNAYTNVMVRKMFEFTLSALGEMKRNAPRMRARALKRRGLREAEMKRWAVMARRMRTNFNPRTGLYEQHDGFFDLPHIDVDSIPVNEFPLYRHWPYLRIFRYDMLKQPDVLLLMLFFSRDYSQKVKKANYLYYEPRCVHESSLSPAIHSILAAELGMHRKAYEYFGRATRLDLDDYNRNTWEGLHTTSMAAAWRNIVEGFGGMRTDGDLLSFNPSLPANWSSFSFRIIYRGSILKVSVERRAASFTSLGGQQVEFEVFGRKYRTAEEPIKVKIPARRRGDG